MLSGLFKSSFFLITDIFLLAFGETIDEKNSALLAV